MRFVFNPHWHQDHTGGNENVGGAGALIVAHENVRERMSVEQELEYFGQRMTTPASPSGPPPLITDALRAMRKAVADLVLEGHPLDHILEFRPLQAQAEAWGQDRQTEDGFVGTIYESVTAR